MESSILKNQYNAEDYKDGYWELYYTDGELAYKGNFLNGFQVGYWEYYHSKNELYLMEYFVV